MVALKRAVELIVVMQLQHCNITGAQPRNNRWPSWSRSLHWLHCIPSIWTPACPVWSDVGDSFLKPKGDMPVCAENSAYVGDFSLARSDSWWIQDTSFECEPALPRPLKTVHHTAHTPSSWGARFRAYEGQVHEQDFWPQLNCEWTVNLWPKQASQLNTRVCEFLVVWACIHWEYRWCPAVEQGCLLLKSLILLCEKRYVDRVLWMCLSKILDKIGSAETSL